MDETLPSIAGWHRCAHTSLTEEKKATRQGGNDSWKGGLWSWVWCEISNQTQQMMKVVIPSLQDVHCWFIDEMNPKIFLLFSKMFGWLPSSVIFILFVEEDSLGPSCLVWNKLNDINSRHLCGHLTAQRHGVRHGDTAARAAWGVQVPLVQDECLGIVAWGLSKNSGPKQVDHRLDTPKWYDKLDS